MYVFIMVFKYNDGKPRIEKKKFIILMIVSFDYRCKTSLAINVSSVNVALNTKDNKTKINR